MAFNTASFILSAPKVDFCPEPDKPEICFAGRSNVGKSSLINALISRKNLARTSNVPGKTQEMNYYLVDERWYLVDLPGYGFAKVSKKERERWGRDIKKYLLSRQTLHLVALVVDFRHEPSQLDEDFMYWMAEQGIAFAIFASKMDKLSSNKQQASLRALKKVLEEMNIEVPVIPFSATSKEGIEEIREIVQEFLTLPPKSETETF